MVFESHIMKTGDAAKHFGLSNETIRRWIDRFNDHLSDSARGVNRAHRILNEDDFIVLATIKELTNQGLSLDEIADKLAGGYRADDVSAAYVGYEDGRLVPAAMVEQVIDGAELRVELEQVKAERDKLLQMLEEAQRREDNTREKLEGQIGVLSQKLEEAQKILAELQYRLGQAEGELGVRREQSQKKRGWFGSD